MGWSLGHDPNWGRDIGYGVPATCDHPGCGAEIDRGLGNVCGRPHPYGGEDGCGLFFCSDHLGPGGLCLRCRDGMPAYDPTPDSRRWIEHKLTHASWVKWRAANPDAVKQLEAALQEA